MRANTVMMTADRMIELALALLLLLILYFAGDFGALLFNKSGTVGAITSKSSRSAPLGSESDVTARFTGRLKKKHIFVTFIIEWDKNHVTDYQICYEKQNEKT